jgi:hypothetical protein
MSYVKSKVNQSTFQVIPGTVLEGEVLNSAWLNFIQNQLQEFLNSFENTILNGWRVCFFKKVITPTTNKILVDGALIGNPVVYVNGQRKTSYERSMGPDGVSDFSFRRFESEITAETISIIGTQCIVYYYSAFPHASTHSVGSTDEINIHNLGGLTAAEIESIIPDNVNSAEMKTLAENVKRSTSRVLAVRKLIDGDGMINEIYDIGII